MYWTSLSQTVTRLDCRCRLTRSSPLPLPPQRYDISNPTAINKSVTRSLYRQEWEASDENPLRVLPKELRVSVPRPSLPNHRFQNRKRCDQRFIDRERTDPNVAASQ